MYMYSMYVYTVSNLKPLLMDTASLINLLIWFLTAFPFCMSSSTLSLEMVVKSLVFTRRSVVKSPLMVSTVAQKNYEEKNPQVCFYLKYMYRKWGKFCVENFSCCIFSCGEIFVIYCIDEIFTLS